MICIGTSMRVSTHRAPPHTCYSYAVLYLSRASNAGVTPSETLSAQLLSRYRMSPMSLCYCLYLLFGFSYPLQYYTEGEFPPRHFVVTPTLRRVTSEFPPIQYFTVAPCAYFQYCTVAAIARYTLLQHTPHFLLLTVSLTVEKMQCANHGLSRPHNPLRD